VPRTPRTLLVAPPYRDVRAESVIAKVYKAPRAIYEQRPSQVLGPMDEVNNLIEVHQSANGLRVVKREFVVKGSKLEVSRQVVVTTKPQSNGEFGITLKALSHPAALTIFQERKAPLDLDCTNEDIDSALGKVEDVRIMQEKLQLPNPMQRMFFRDEDFAALITAGTTFNADHVLSVVSLVRTGKALGLATISYMYDKTAEEADQFLRRLSLYYPVRYADNRLEPLTKRGLEALYES